MKILGKELDVTIEQVEGFAVNKGYQKIKKINKEIKKINPDLTEYKIIEKEEINNPETAIEYIERLYYTPALNDITAFFKKEAKKSIIEARKLEDEAIDKTIDDKIDAIIK